MSYSNHSRIIARALATMVIATPICAFGVTAPAAAQAQTAAQARTYSFDIAAGPLGTALRAYARTADRQLVFTNDLVKGKRSSAVRGTMTSDEALRLLLSGSGFDYRVNAAGVVMIVEAASAPASNAAPAQPAARTERASVEDNSVSTIVVTGTQVRRAGYNEPTPTTTLSRDDIDVAAPALLADYLIQQPALAGSYGTRVLGLSSGPNSGANILNLRNLGPTRTLVLLDGRRVVPTLPTGQVDVNLLPQGLVKRVDIVTGGASAGWGSDAVAGVVNFVLDTKFEGFKAVAQGGATQKGDAENYQFGATYGREFADGRGHFLLDGQTNYAGRGDVVTSRDWFNSTKVIANPDYAPGNGEAQNIVETGVGLSGGTQGGLIVGGPLRGIQFTGPDGTPTPFDFGTVAGLYSYGGSSEDYGAVSPLQNPVRTSNAFARASYDITNDITAYAEFSYAHSNAKTDTIGFIRLGNITVNADNAFLDPEIRDSLNTLGETSFQFGTTNQNLGLVKLDIDRELIRGVVGLDGRFGDGWTWNAYYQHGVTNFQQSYNNNPIKANYERAIDAVRDPDTGAIVCRSTLTDPADGCVPLNIFGVRAPTAAQRDYLTGSSIAQFKFKQDVASASLRGEPFDNWAGPVSLAAGLEYRRDYFGLTSDPLSQQAVFYVGNAQPTSGVISAREGFAEVVFPLVSDAPFFQNFDLNGAVRVTDYSTSGTVTTWKGGLTWEVNDSLRFRGTRSRDIRAGNHAEVFTAQAFGVQSIDDPVTGTSSIVSLVAQGNRSIQPEKADTLIGGVVYQPEWLPNFSASVDYYRIKIKDAIVTPTAQQTLNVCLNGNASVCDSITRDGASNIISQIIVQAQNVNRESESGLDFETSYHTDVPSLDGALSFRLLANYVRSRKLDAFGTVIEYAGTNADSNNKGTALPHWRGTFRTGFTADQYSLAATARFIGAGRVTNVPGLVEGGKIPAIAYIDLSAAFRPSAFEDNAELFFVVENLFDQDPPAAPTLGTSSILSTGTNGYLYDLLGRQFRAGVRLHF